MNCPLSSPRHYLSWRETVIHQPDLPLLDMVCKFFIIFVLAKLASAADGATWNYEDTSKWADDFPACAGLSQSPIDITGATEKEYPKMLSFSTNYMTDISGKLFNNGHTVQFNLDASEPWRLISMGPLEDKTYRLVQFHLHWGSDSTKGSEHLLAGTAFPAEIHLVHADTALGEELVFSKAGDLAVLGLFIEVGDDPAMALMPLVDELMNLKNKDDSTEITINMAKILSGVTDFSKWTTYEGSLTTPGCGEVVTWINMEDPIKMAEADLAKLRKLKDSDKKPMVDNFRPPQGLNGRTIFKNKPI